MKKKVLTVLLTGAPAAMEATIAPVSNTVSTFFFIEISSLNKLFLRISYECIITSVCPLMYAIPLI